MILPYSVGWNPSRTWRSRIENTTYTGIKVRFGRLTRAQRKAKKRKSR